MASSRETVITCVLSKLMAAGYELPHAKSDPAYQAMIDLYCDQLRPFDSWELQEGIRGLIQTRKSRKWPMIGEIVEHCSGRLHPSKRDQVALPKPEKPQREPDPPHIRELLQWKIRIWDEWKANGRYMAKNPDGSWRYGIEDLNREAEARMADAAGQSRRTA